MDPAGEMGDSVDLEDKLFENHIQCPAKSGSGLGLGTNSGATTVVPENIDSSSDRYPPNSSAHGFAASYKTGDNIYPELTSQKSVQSSKVDQVKSWTIDTIKTTKQFINEKLGKGSRTVDPQLDAKIHELRELQAKYTKLIDQTSSLRSYFGSLIQTQKAMADTFADLAQKEPRLAEDFSYNAETQRVLICNGEQLLGALSFFISSMGTLCTKTIQDCLETVKKYEMARLQYDTYRNEHEQSLHTTNSSNPLRISNLKEKYDQHRKRYEQLRDDVSVKLRFLDENKVKVVHRQLLLFHNAIAAYFSGNQKQLSTVLSQFSVKLRAPNSEPPSWLEK